MNSSKNICSRDASVGNGKHFEKQARPLRVKDVQTKYVDVHVPGSVKTGLMDCDNFDETLTLDHLLLRIVLYRHKTKFDIRKSNTKSSLRLVKMAKR